MENNDLSCEQKKTDLIAFFVVILIFAVILGCAIGFEHHSTEQAPIQAAAPIQISLPDFAKMLLSNAITTAQQHIQAIPRPIYEIAADALAGEEPNPDCYGSTDDPSSLQWLLDEASRILDGQTTLFSTDTQLLPGTSVTYYLDETIFAISWKEVIDNFVYTFAEVKVAHPSQFRRYFVNVTYNSAPLYTTAKMAPMVNAVVASSGDYYRGRKHGIVVYEGTVYRFYAADKTDVCFVDTDGNLIVKPHGSFTTMEEAQQFVDENNISFSLSFGPILIQDGVRCEPASYCMGEVNDNYPRAALCQRDQLHYVVVTANGGYRYWQYETIHQFADNLSEMGFKTAYTLDGGNTGTIVMNDVVQNPINPQKMRAISDCLYFATAYPHEFNTATEEPGS